VRAYLADVHFVFFTYGDWTISSAAFIFSVSWASLSRTDRTFSPLFYTLTVIFNVSRSLSFTYKIGCDVQRVKQMHAKTQPLFLLLRMARCNKKDGFSRRHRETSQA
jgi:hypothetical protein